MDLTGFSEKAMSWLLSSGLRILLVIIITLIAVKVARVLASRLSTSLGKQLGDEESRKRVKTLSAVIRNLLTVVILLVACMIILGELGIEIGPLLAAAGIVGLAVGFGAQSLVKDVINGFFILLNDQIRVGDVVEIGGKGGVVEKVNLRMTILRDLSGNVHFIPNGTIDVLTNMTKDFSRYVFNIGVAYREDVDEVIEIIKEVDEDLRKDPAFGPDITEPIEVLGLDEFADSAVIIKARATTKPIKQWKVAREFNRRLKKRFDEKNIEIPFPHLTLYVGEDKEGKAPPLRISKEDG
ncbi:MAG: mechanosensitive ion channel protein MscS [Latescibacteria bacterium DG_63]|nr:MAG: mechanosensitive ion channel protein MscS [Latescibacteria bacterium DG_63]